MDLRQLGEMIDLLRSKGVHRYKSAELATNGGELARLEVELFPPVDDTPEAKPGPNPDACRCGHLSHEHGPDGLCLHGCDIERCAPEEAKT